MAATKTKKATSSKTSAAKPAAKSSAKTKTTSAKAKTTGAKKTKKTTKAKVAKTTKTTKTTKTAVKRKPATAKKGKNVVAVFLADVVKQATKVQKKAQGETKVWIKKLNAQDKQLSQLTKKTIKAKGKSKTSLEKKISKLQNEMSETRTGLLNAENATDKVATLIEWVGQLNAKPAVTAYLQPKTTSKPTLVKNTSSSNAGSKKNNPAPAPYEDEDYIEDNDEEMNFLFGEDDDEEANR